MMKLLTVADGAVDPFTGGVVHVRADGAARPFLKAMAVQASGSGHLRAGPHSVRLPGNVPPHLLQAGGHVRLMAGVTAHSLMLTAPPLVQGFAHCMAGTA